MDPLLPPLAFVYGVAAGLLVFTMVGRWIVTLVSVVQSYRANAERRSGLWGLITPSLLHSGPWALAIAAYLSYYVLSRPHAAWWFWFFSGVCIAPVVVMLAITNAARRKKKEENDVPLTPDSLNLRRKHFVWGTTLFFGGGMSALMISGLWATLHALGFMIFVVAVCMGAGYVFAIIMWEWKKSVLQAKDSERRRAQGGG